MISELQQTGKIIGISGENHQTAPMLLSLSVRLQKSGKVLFIDAGNVFNPYYIQKTSHINTKKILNNIMVARPITLDHLQSLIQKLDKTAFNTKSKGIIISNIDQLFYGQESEEDKLAILENISNELEYISTLKDLPVIISISNKENIITKKINEKINFSCRI